MDGVNQTGNMTGNLGTGTTSSNPFGMPASWQAWQQGLSGLSNALQSGGASGGSNFMRPNATASFNQGTPNQLLATILQMRAAQAAGLGQPYQQGVAMPRVSLLTG